jgi:hypothetical protein
MAEFEKAFSKLQNVCAGINYKRGTIPPKVVRKALRPAYDRLCAAYGETTIEQRIDTYVFFETRDNLLEELLHYAIDQAAEASRHLKIDKLKLAQLCVEKAAAADLMVEGRSDPNLIYQSQKEIARVSAEVGFDLAQYTAKLDLNASTFSRAAVQLHAKGQSVDAIQALGIAFQMNPDLSRHPKAIDLAVKLTGKSADAAVALLSDRFERTLYIDDQARLTERKARRKKPAAAPNFWLVTWAGVIFLALLPPLTFPLVFGVKTDASGVPSGLIVGTVFSFVYLMGRLKQRNSSR